MTPKRAWRASMDRLVDALQEHVRPGRQSSLPACRTKGSPALRPSRCAPDLAGAVALWAGNIRADRQAQARRDVRRCMGGALSSPEILDEEHFATDATASRPSRTPTSPSALYRRRPEMT